MAVLGDFVGTTLLLFLAFAGTIVGNVGARESTPNTTTNETVGFSPIVNLYVAVSFGFSLMVNVWIFFRVSGGLFNKFELRPSTVVHQADVMKIRLSLSAW